MGIVENKVGARSLMLCDQTLEVRLYFVGKRKLWKVFDQGGDRFRAELWDDLSVTQGKIDKREEGLGIRPPIRKGGCFSVPENMEEGTKYNRSQDGHTRK